MQSQQDLSSPRSSTERSPPSPNALFLVISDLGRTVNKKFFLTDGFGKRGKFRRANPKWFREAAWGEYGIAVLGLKNLFFVLENLSSQWVALYAQTLLPYLALPRMRRGRYRTFAPVAATGWKTDACAENNKLIRLGDEMEDRHTTKVKDRK